MLVNKMSRQFSKLQKHLNPVRVAVTGAAGQIGYSLLFRIASGQMLGANQPVIMHLIDVPQAMDSLKGVKMELEDCAFPLLAGVVCTDSASVGFKDIDFGLLVGAKPRGPGMERADLLRDNGKIFTSTGQAIGEHASRNVKILVVGNPANTNAFITMTHAVKQGLKKESFTAMTRLDHNRGQHQLAQKLNHKVEDIKNFVIWGNHSSTMFPDTQNVQVNDKKIHDTIDQTWYNKDFIPCVQQRGSAIIAARKLSSAASAANAAIDHIRDWHLGSQGNWVSMAVPSDGSYGVDKDTIFSFPCTTKDGAYSIVKNLQLT